MVEEDDLAPSELTTLISIRHLRSGREAHLGEHGVYRSRVVRRPVALRPLIPCADELVYREVRILRVRLSEYPPRAVEQAARLRRRAERALCKLQIRVRVREHVALQPVRDRRRPAVEHGLPADDADRDGDVGELDVVEDERAGEFAVARSGAADEDGSVGDDGVDDGFGSDGLSRLRQAACRQIESDLNRKRLSQNREARVCSKVYLAVIDGDALECPS